jgi:hypothetical protein
VPGQDFFINLIFFTAVLGSTYILTWECIYILLAYINCTKGLHCDIFMHVYNVFDQIHSCIILSYPSFYKILMSLIILFHMHV